MAPSHGTFDEGLDAAGGVAVVPAEYASGVLGADVDEVLDAIVLEHEEAGRPGWRYVLTERRERLVAGHSA
jgi:hypothetical protein